MRVLGPFVGAGPLCREVRQSAVTRLDGIRSNEEIPTCMAAADLLVLPSYGEGLPTVLVEAGAMGVPILAASVCGVSELIGKDYDRLVPSHSADALAQGIREILADPGSAMLRARRFRCHVEEICDADRNASRLIEIYASLMCSRRPSGRGGQRHD
jgi:teichuronic acid biosynthesis glycosyltransferase TuaC